MVKVYVATKRRDLGRRQDGRPPRQQGRHLQDPARRGHAVPGGRHAGQILLNPLGVPSRMNVGQILETHLGWAGRQARLPGGHAGVRRGDRGGDPRAASKEAGLPETRQERAVRRPHRRAVRAGDDGRLHLHAQAAPPGGRQGPRPQHRARTRSSRSSRWAARPASAASGSARWKCGRWRPTAPPTSCRNC